MDTPVASIFQGTDINVNNSRNEEEEEDLEDQKRRNEELQNLLMTKLDDFNYDESTVNSSIVSAISLDDSQNRYLKAGSQNEQLKVLYEVRGRELQALREEYKNEKEKMTRELEAVKKKLMLSEAEFEQLKVSYKNSEELLIDQKECIKELTSVLENKEKQIESYIRNTEDLHVEIATYKSTLDDLNLIHGNRNPFNNSNKQFNSEELKAAHKEQISRLENLIEEKNRYANVIEKENVNLKEELNKLIGANEDHTKLITTLTKNFESAQNQCEDLIDVVETLSNENKHLQDRVNNAYISPKRVNSSDYTSLASHVEKLKKMLVDKSVEINTLNAKLRNYEENLKELLEYRKLKAESYQKEFQQCNNEDHTKKLIVMQNDLQNYRRIIEDKNQQILNLNSTNKDLLAKMEETLSQTRNDIKKFSNKYSLPQLEKMAENLKTAQNQIVHLEEELKVSEAKRLSLIQKNPNGDKLKEELEALKTVKEKERINFENEIKKLQQELDFSKDEINNLKQNIKELLTDNAKIQTQYKNNEVEYESLKNQNLELVQDNHNSQKKVKQLEEMIDELTNLKTIAEGDRCTFEFEAKDAQNNLEKAKNYITHIETELNNKSKILQEKDEIIEQLEKAVSNIKDELNRMLQNKEEKVCLCKNKNYDTKTNKEPETDKKRRNLDAELRAVEELEKDKEANLIALEIKLRDELQEEYFIKLKEIEKNYEAACTSSKNICKDNIHKLKSQESKFREYLSIILSECTQKIKEFEEDRKDLLKNINVLQNQFEEFKAHTRKREEYFRKLIHEMQAKHRRDAEKWKLWSQKLVNSCLKIESSNKKSRDSILYNMQRYDKGVESIEKNYEKVKKKLAHHK